MSAQVLTRRLTISDLQKKTINNEKIVMLTCYDASFAKVLDMAKVDCILIGDSLGNVIQGKDSTLSVSLDDIIYHTKCVKRGCQTPLIIADMPFGTSQVSPKKTYENAVKLLAAGANMVKIEGGEEMVSTTAFLTSRGIPVCSHIGLTPQSVNTLGGYKVQGRDESAAAKMKQSALALQDAGATMIVLEAIPSALGEELSKILDIITIGIGAGAATDGQVLVLQDMLNIPPSKKAKFVKNYMAAAIANGGTDVLSAVELAVKEIKNGDFPSAEYSYN